MNEGIPKEIYGVIFVAFLVFLFFTSKREPLGEVSNQIEDHISAETREWRNGFQNPFIENKEEAFSDSLRSVFDVAPEITENEVSNLEKKIKEDTPLKDVCRFPEGIVMSFPIFHTTGEYKDFEVSLKQNYEEVLSAHLIYSGLRDDSVRSVLYTAVLTSRDPQVEIVGDNTVCVFGEGSVLLEEWKRVGHACQVGRGHQDFSEELCI